MKKDDLESLDLIIQAFLRSKGYDTADYLCIITEPGVDNVEVLTCMDPRTAIHELGACHTAFSANLERLTQ